MTGLGAAGKPPLRLGGEPFDGVLDGGSFGGAAAGGSETSTKPHPQVAP